MIKYPKIPKGADLSRIHESLRDKACPIGMLTGHPDNPRLHPESNKNAIKGSLERYQQRIPIVANVMDEGLRIEAHHEVYRQMVGLGSEFVAVTIVEDDPVTELGFLLAENRTGDLSSDDPEKLAPIIRQLIEAGEDVEEIGWDDEAIEQLIGDVDDDGNKSVNNDESPMNKSGENLPNDQDWGNALDGLPTGDKSPFQQMTFTLHDSQVETVKEAMEAARKLGAFVDTGNENGNGNALARVCEMFLGMEGVK